MKDAPNWGITPVPERLRVLGAFDGLLLWSNLSVSLLVIVAGAFLVLPADQFGLALSLPVATGASALSEQFFGFGGVAFWKIVFGCVATGLALLGPVGFVRKYIRKFAVW